MELLECSYKTKSAGDGSRIAVVVHAGEYFRVKTFILGDYKRILDCTKQAEVEVAAEQLVKCVAECDVVAADEACILYEVAALVELAVLFLEEVSVSKEVGELILCGSCVEHA